MNLQFKKIEIKNDDDRKKALQNIRILENTTAEYIAAVNRRLYIKN